jgi:aryl-alcohol dehydrogenase-like predicted oxidoreductase
MSDWPNDTFLSAVNIRKACDASLKRLQTDYIDLYQFHHIDRNTPWEEIWEAVSVLRQQGKIIYAGSSNFAGWHIAKAQEAAKARNFFGLVSEQSIYNLARRQVELEVVPACEDYGLGLIPWSPLHGGLLAGVLRKEKEGSRRQKGRAKDAVEEHRSQLEAYEKACADFGEEPAHIGLAWLLHQPVVTAPIIGPRTQEQLDGALRALEIKLGDDELARLDEIWPGYKTAPEEYAW